MGAACTRSPSSRSRSARRAMTPIATGTSRRRCRRTPSACTATVRRPVRASRTPGRHRRAARRSARYRAALVDPGLLPDVEYRVEDGHGSAVPHLRRVHRELLAQDLALELPADRVDGVTALELAVPLPDPEVERLCPQLAHPPERTSTPGPVRPSMPSRVALAGVVVPDARHGPVCSMCVSRVRVRAARIRDTVAFEGVAADGTSSRRPRALVRTVSRCRS